MLMVGRDIRLPSFGRRRSGDCILFAQLGTDAATVALRRVDLHLEVALRVHHQVERHTAGL
jgi:hypothetical protein